MIQKTIVDLNNANCVEGMAALDENSIDVCVTSPPYNLGVQYGKYDDGQDRRKYLDWTREWAKGLRRVLRDDGSFFLNVGAAPSNPMLPHEILFELKDLFVLQNTIHWIKSITVETRKGEILSIGHFKPIRSNRFITDCHEFIFHLTKTGSTPIDRLSIGVPYADKSNISRWSHTNGKDKRCRGNTWFIPYQTIQNRYDQRPHPATFPKELPKMCIQLHGWRPDLVMLDPFLGIGSSAVAALESSIKRFVGFEIDEEYLMTANEILSQIQKSQHPPNPKCPPAKLSATPFFVAFTATTA
jgi:site-specific DNA-methyltransferase (adenine-specific)